MNENLSSTFYIDTETADIVSAAAETTAGLSSDREKASALFYLVRDKIKYNPYTFTPDKNSLIASRIMKKGEGYCVQKAVLYAALARAAAIPCRLGFANVKNHLTTPRLKELMGSDIFVFHGYNSVFVDGKWLKATPTFDIGLCERFGVRPLEFDALNDAVFHEFDVSGRKHMEYIHDYGTFSDLPYDLMMSELAKNYPALAEKLLSGKFSMTGDFSGEAGILT
jgi:transglutaminase-like putative cysteine protease